MRGFDLDEYLSFCDEPGAAVPWAIGDEAWENAEEEEEDPSVEISGETQESVPGAAAAFVSESTTIFPGAASADLFRSMGFASSSHEDCDRMLPIPPIEMAVNRNAEIGKN